MNKDILDILHKDAKKTPAQIAVMLGMNEEEVAKSIKQMEESGIIRKYKTVINWEKTGEEKVFAFIDVRVSPSRGVGFDDVAKRIYEFPEVHSVYLVSGDMDLRVVIEGKTMKEVAFFVAEKLATIEGVLSTRTSFLLKKYKEDGDAMDGETADNRLAVSP
ncbi:MAG: Lrp/AsnC family transcriptional regulator [Armatimonadota bacterium]